MEDLCFRRPSQVCYVADVISRRLYFFRTSRKRSCGSAVTELPTTPDLVSAPIIALMMVCSVACTAGLQQGSVSGLRVAYREGDEDIFRSVAGRQTAPYRSGLAIGQIEDELPTRTKPLARRTLRVA